MMKNQGPSGDPVQMGRSYGATDALEMLWESFKIPFGCGLSVLSGCITVGGMKPYEGEDGFWR